MWKSHLLIIAATLIPSLLVLVVLSAARAWRVRTERISPLTKKVLSLPGEQLRKDVIKHSDSFSEAAALSLFIGPLVLCAWLLGRIGDVDWSGFRYGVGDWFIWSFGALLLMACIVAMLRAGKRLRRAKQGLEAELAVGQQLSMLQSAGAYVYHDFQTDRGNIDHIVVGRSVVFAIETKSRRKPRTGGKQSSQVDYDGTWLRFPGDIREKKPIEQASYQAQWLEAWLRKQVGGSVRVVPLVALPGWYVRNVAGGRAEVLVNNCHSPQFMMGEKFGPPLDDGLRRRIAELIEEKYPPLELDPKP